MAEQIQKGRLFGSGRELNVRRFNPNAARIPAAGRPQNQYLQAADAAMGIVEFAAEQRNAGIRSKYARTQSEVNLAWETAYQKAKAENPDSPEVWTQAADMAGNAAIDGRIDAGDSLSNIISGDDRIRDRLDTSLISMKAAKAADVQQGRVDARIRDFELASRTGVANLRESLRSSVMATPNTDKSMEWDEDDRIEWNLLQTRRARNDALKAYGEFNENLKADSQVPSAKKLEMRQNYAKEIADTFVDHIIDKDPAHATKYFDAINGIANDSSVKNIIRADDVYQAKLDLASAQKHVEKLNIDARTEVARSKLDKYRTSLASVHKSIEDGVNTEFLIARLWALETTKDDLLATRAKDAKGKSYLLYSADAAARITNEYDKVVVTILSPIYQEMATTLAILANDEHFSDPATMNNAALHLQKLRRTDPHAFFKLADTLSQKEQNEIDTLLNKIVAKEAGHASLAARAKRASDFDSRSAASLDNVISEMNVLLSEIGKNPDGKGLLRLQEFVRTRVQKDFFDTIRGKNRSGKFRTDAGQLEKNLEYRNKLSAALGKGLAMSDRIDLATEVHGRSTDFPILFGLMSRAGLGDKMLGQRREALRKKKAVLATGIRNGSARLIDSIKDGTKVAGATVKTLKDNLHSFGNLLQVSKETHIAISNNIDGLVKLYGMVQSNSAALNENLILNPHQGAGTLDRLDKLYNSLALTEKQLEDAGGEDRVTVDLEGESINLPSIPPDVIEAMYGAESGGRLLPHVKTAIREFRESVDRRRKVLDHRFPRNPQSSKEHGLKDWGLTEIKTDEATGFTASKIDHFLRDPNSFYGRQVTKVIDNIDPSLVYALAPKIKQRVGSVLISNTPEDRQALLRLAQVAYRAELKLSGYNLDPPKEIKQIAAAFELAKAQVTISEASTERPEGDVDGFITAIQTALKKPDLFEVAGRIGQDELEIGTVTNNFLSPHPSVDDDDVEEIFADSIEDAMERVKYFSVNETVRTYADNPNSDYHVYGKHHLSMIKRNIQPTDPDYLTQFKKQLDKVYKKAELTGALGQKAFTMGAETTLADDSELGRDPVEWNYTTNMKELITRRYGEQQSFNVRNILARSAMTLSVLEKMRAEGLPLEQMRSAVTRGDLEAIFSRGEIADFDWFADIKTGGKKTDNPIFNHLINQIELWSQENYKQQFFPSGYTQEAIERGSSNGIWASRSRSAFWLWLAPSLTNTPNSNSLELVEAVKVNGKAVLDSNGLRKYNVQISLPRSLKVPESAREDVRSQLEQAGVLEQVDKQSLTLSNWKIPTGEAQDGTMAGDFMHFVYTDLLISAKRVQAASRRQETAPTSGIPVSRQETGYFGE